MSNYVSTRYIKNIGIREIIYTNKDGKRTYLLNNGLKYKEFPADFRDMHDEDVRYMHDCLLEQSKIRLKTVIVPEKLVVDDNNLYGYIAPFVDGKPIKDIDPEFLIDELMRIIREIEEDVKALSREGWRMEDMHDQNLLISDRLLTGSIIDTDCYEKTKDALVAKKNLASIFNAIIYSVLPRIQLSKSFKKEIIQRYFYMASQGLIPTSEFLQHLLCELKQFDKIVSKYSKIDTNIDAIEKKLENQKLILLKDITLFDTMYDKNLEYFKELSLYIIAGERKLKELREVVLPELVKKAQESGEQLDAQKVNDMENTIIRFEKKIYDLKTTRIISIQMAPQIRLLQNNDAELVEKIQSSITNTIPLWKNQIVLALGINNAKRALESQQAVSNLTNDMLKKNSEILKQGSIEIAEESERAIVDIETLQKTNKDLIDTLDTVIKIHEDGRAKRQESEKVLESIEKELKQKMVEIKMPTNK